MDYVTIVFKAVDIPLVIGIVAFIQVLKKQIKINTKWWALINVLMGFFAAWLKIDAFKDGNVKGMIIQGLVYGAACEFVYQSWRTITGVLKPKKEKK